MALLKEIKVLLEGTLQIKLCESDSLGEMVLLGGIPEFDSMAVVTLLTAIEEQFDIIIDDDEVDASIFETLDSLVSFVEKKV